MNFGETISDNNLDTSH